MLARRSLAAFARVHSVRFPSNSVRAMSTSNATASKTPMEDTMRSKITSHLQPTHLEIHNDSHLHSHHKAMEGSTSQETHFRVVITSEAFKGQGMMGRHKMVYKVLEEEMRREGGIHALQLRTRTGEEVEREEGK